MVSSLLRAGERAQQAFLFWKVRSTLLVFGALVASRSGKSILALASGLARMVGSTQHVAGMERFQGQFKDDRRHGRGTCIYPDGSRYTGEWQAGAVHGEGRFEHANGDTFVGTLATGHRVRGKVTWSGGDEYDGEFSSFDEPHGEGTWHYVAENVVHSGQFHRGAAHGPGERRELSVGGALRRGDFDGATLHGEGSEVLTGGIVGRLVAERYEGEFVHGQRQGRGCVQIGVAAAWTGEWVRSWRGEWEEGEPLRTCDELIEKSKDDSQTVYSGGWAHGMRHGRGRQVEADGRIYDGDWFRGQKDGRGKEVDAARGEVYVGEFLAGRRHGKGRVRRRGGWTFEGQFEGGVQRGEGTLTLGRATDGDDLDSGIDRRPSEDDSMVDADEYGVGDAKDAVHAEGFVDFELHGDGLRTYANGDAYEGELHNELPSGHGTLHYADGGSLQAMWVSGAAEGEAVMSNATGDVYHGPVHESLPSGVGVWEGSDGSRYEGGFAAGMRDGEGKLRLADGGTTEGTWRRGELDGHAEVAQSNGYRYVGEVSAG